MRPHKLTMQAFGPFASKEVVDFERGDDFILITGPTGSGKTTVFDAVTFALYGDFPGTRDGASAVCSLAERDAHPFVEFEFSVRGKKYRVNRIPQHSRPAKRGDGYVDSPQMVELYEWIEDKWHPITGTLKNINLIIEDILHLSPDEFQKIVLLPQGEFQKFLVSETKDKEALLAKIFPVKDHEFIARYIKDVKNEKNALLTGVKSTQDELLKVFKPESFDERHAELIKKNMEFLSEYRKSRDDLDAFLLKIAEEENLEKHFAEYDLLQKELQELVLTEKETGELELRKENAKKLLILKPQVDSFRELLVEIKKREKEKEESEKKLVAERKKYSAIKLEAEEIPVIEKENGENLSELSRLEALIPKEKELIEKRKEFAVHLEEKKRVAGELASVEKKQEVLEKETCELRNGLIEKEKLDETYDKIIDRLMSISLRYEQALEYEKKKKECAGLENNRAECFKKIKDAETSLAINLEAEKEFLRKKDEAMASGLASGLKEGEPCPVCGSMEHPDPANKKIEPFTDEEKLKTLSNNVRNSERDIAAVTEKNKAVEQRLLQLENEIKGLSFSGEKSAAELEGEKKQAEAEKKAAIANREKLKHDKEILEEKEGAIRETRKIFDNLLKEVTEKTTRLAVLEKEKENLESELSGIGSLTNGIQKTRQKIDQNKKKITDITERFQKSLQTGEGLSERVKMASEELEKLKVSSLTAEKKLTLNTQKLGFSNIGEAESFLMSDKEIYEAEKRINAFRDRKTGVESRLSSSFKKIEKKKRPDIESLKKEKENIKKLCTEKEKQKNESEKALQNLEDNKKRYEETVNKIGEISSEFQLLERLSNDLNGYNPRMINFQNFILNAYLREVTGYATERFNVMSEGRYSLVVNDAVFHGRKQAGLELDVYDSYSGQRRSVKTLSGGEKFLASISLALGLSDVIQSRAGMVDLDAIFIDEGFGSLDESALDRALTILDTIRGNRLVGIISHVSELKNRIPSQIQIKKGSRGSFVEQNF